LRVDSSGVWVGSVCSLECKGILKRDFDQ
jgi:hypothetical protein